MRSIHLVAGLMLVLPALAIGQASAPATPSAAAAPAAQGTIARGKALSYTCQGCHGVTGYKNAYPSFHVPRIGGQSAEYLRAALTQYREGKRKHPTMEAQAQSFSDADIDALASYLSTLQAGQ